VWVFPTAELQPNSKQNIVSLKTFETRNFIEIEYNPKFKKIKAK